MTAQNTVKKKQFWKTALIILAGIVLFAFAFLGPAGCAVFEDLIGERVPDLSGLEIEEARNKVYMFQLVVEYEHSDTAAAGIVIRTQPEAGKRARYDSKLTVFVSSGPETIKASAVTADWEQIGSSPDSWNALEAYVTGDYLYILCEATFGTDFSLKGRGQGYASQSVSFEKQVPVMILAPDASLLPQGKHVPAGEAFCFLIKMPVTQFETEKPNYIICKIGCLTGDVQSEIRVSFGIFW